MPFINTRQRSEAPEIMDDFTMTGETLRDSLDQIARINRWLGGNQVTLGGVKKLSTHIPLQQELHILDLGCGNGDLLRIIARWGRRQGRTLRLTGIDANAYTIDYARQLSVEYPEIDYRTEHLPSSWLEHTSYDIALCTLFLHHFPTSELLHLLKVLQQQAKLGIVVNDLHRHRLAYILFLLLTLPISNRMVRDDGLVSILRGFKRHEIESWAQQLAPARSQIHWRWAFRYQWIIHSYPNKEV
ncbi:MAG: methyltransferase domain-containing protein [Bacteroidetes bacterium]|nr:MAG: methyltransferase domain-containing protein [Bacteroidota bacterium]